MTRPYLARNRPKGTSMTDLAKIIAESVEQTMTPEVIREKVDARVDKLVNEVLTDELRSYGDIGKLIKDRVKESLKVESLDLPSYGQMITKMLKAQIEQTVHPLVSGQLAKDMEELLKLAPKQIALSEITSQMMEDRLEHGDPEHGDLITCIVEKNEYGSTWVYLDEDHHWEDRDKYRCAANMLISKDGTISSASHNGREIGKPMRGKGGAIRVGSVYGLGQRLAAYHACGTVITLDVENVNTYNDYD